MRFSYTAYFVPVDGVIHRGAGKELFDYNRDMHRGGCETGEAKISPGFKLPAKCMPLS